MLKDILIASQKVDSSTSLYGSLGSEAVFYRFVRYSRSFASLLFYCDHVLLVSAIRAFFLLLERVKTDWKLTS